MSGALVGPGEGPPDAAEVDALLAEPRTWVLATTRDDLRPHAVPLLAVLLDGALHLAAGPSTAKARHLRERPDCVLVAVGEPFDLVVEGRARRVDDDTTLRRVAERYADTYGWEPEARDGALHGEGAPTAGPPPYAVWRVEPQLVRAFPTDDAREAAVHTVGAAA